jgi:tetratricopeptide (TPR) repeat protein
MPERRNDPAWAAIKRSTELLEIGETQEAFETLDTFLMAAVDENRSDWVRLVAGTGAVMADAAGEHERAKRYYEQSLSYAPNDPQALYGLAKAMLNQGQPELAKQYATRSYELSNAMSTDLHNGLTELILKEWPELDERK